eukprot:CAMPEP_0113911378 /NCGR_PEP_ID=MMETSP0780_2-20120614/28169_1 /TAXON_ID=652834 /ORGANISM="Palpitomonas bilix" /LENGTH=240 /DNA_ID=CAMNT_0000907881 /DNA_START=292 /DNA_END=1011 /DNA_ORIENTATION=- /assembly_acc=CAM_ASM_000599
METSSLEWNALTLGNDTPGPRCGHTLSSLTLPPECRKWPSFGAVNSIASGKSGLDVLILFGGWCAHNAVTNRVHVLCTSASSVEAPCGPWVRLRPAGHPPTPRQAHAASVVGMSVLVYGGKDQYGHLVPDTLHMLSLRSTGPEWLDVPLAPGSPTPGARYGHALCASKSLLLLFGGSDGSKVLDDLWALPLESRDVRWRKIEVSGVRPPPRVYGAAGGLSLDGEGGVWVFGGRGNDGRPL